MKHYLLSILIVCIFALVLSGCAGGKTEEAEDSVSDTDTFISAADAPAEWNGVYRCGEGSSEKTLTINGSDSTSFHFSLEVKDGEKSGSLNGTADFSGDEYYALFEDDSMFSIEFIYGDGMLSVSEFTMTEGENPYCDDGLNFCGIFKRTK